MSPKPSDGMVGPWARAKLEALNSYLDYYTKRLKNQRSWLKSTIYVDAFAGPGLARVRHRIVQRAGVELFASPAVPPEAEVLKGSPRIALEITNPFDRYVFVDIDPVRVADLELLKAEYGQSRRIEIMQSDANAALSEFVASCSSWKKTKAVVFLDPFGMQVPWSTIQLLARTKGIEILLNLPFHMAVTRLITKSGRIIPAWQRKLDDFFGSKDWRDLAYETSRDMIGERTMKHPDAVPRLLQWYRERLAAAFGHVSSARLIRNTRGHRLYYIVWAGPHPAGLEGAEYILRHGED